MKALLLLSGGRDSAEALHRLVGAGHDVTCLTFDGYQRSEINDALLYTGLVQYHRIIRADWFDETTFNPWRLFKRFWRAFPDVWRAAIDYEVKAIATGIKKTDFAEWRFLYISYPLAWLLFRLIGIKIIFPVWNLIGSKKMETRTFSGNVSLEIVDEATGKQVKNLHCAFGPETAEQVKAANALLGKAMAAASDGALFGDEFNAGAEKGKTFRAILTSVVVGSDGALASSLNLIFCDLDSVEVNAIQEVWDTINGPGHNPKPV